MDSKKSNKISDIVRLQQILKRWKKQANATKVSTKNSKEICSITSTSNNNSGSSKGIKFLKRTLSFTDITSSSSNEVPKGYLAVCVGKELKRFIIPTEYLGHQAFRLLLQEAEEEFGFQQEGVLKIPCEVTVFEKILKMVEEKRDAFLLHEVGLDNKELEVVHCTLSESELTQLPHHPQMCR